MARSGDGYPGQRALAVWKQQLRHARLIGRQETAKYLDGVEPLHLRSVNATLPDSCSRAFPLGKRSTCEPECGSTMGLGSIETAAARLEWHPVAVVRTLDALAILVQTAVSSAYEPAVECWRHFYTDQRGQVTALDARLPMKVKALTLVYSWNTYLAPNGADDS